MPYCIVKTCKNRGKIKGVSYHRIFTNKAKDWLDLINRTPRKKFSTRSVICSDHFQTEDLIIYPNKVMVKEGAKPSLFLIEGKARGTAVKSLNFNQSNDAHIEKTPSVSKSTDSIMEMDVTTDDLISKIHGYSQSQTSPLKGKRNLLVEEEIEIISQSEPIEYATSSSDSLGLKNSPKKRRRLAKMFHNYYLSPRKMHRQLEIRKNSMSIMKKKLKVTKQHVRRLKRQVQHLGTIVKDLRDKKMMSDYSLQHLDELCSGIPAAIMKRCLTVARSGKLNRLSYPVELREFAMTLQFYSPKAYEYVRKTFYNSLPHQATIRKWTAAINCEPGFSKLCFDTLKLKVEEERTKGNEILCALIVDEMSIMKHLDCIDGKTWGYVDLGTGAVEDKFATQAFVAMIVAVNNKWKLPIAYFFIESLNAEERANIIRECLIRLAEVGIKVISLTCDGPTVNFTMMQKLGCNVRDIMNINSKFKHPTQEHDVHVILDVCHMLKLLRNKWSDLEAFKDPEGNLVSFSFIKKLHQLQESEQLYAANKLRKKHLDWRKQKMKVSLAAQTLSASVASALEFVKNDLKLEDFKDSGATIKYIRLVDEVFDILNSKNPFAKGFKSPLSLKNEHLRLKTLNNMVTYLINCTDVKGIPLYATPRKTPIFGFIITINSVISMFNIYVKPTDSPLKYLLTFKFSQDHLELFFCAMRARNGWNNNPSALKFYQSYKKLLLHNTIRGSNEGNVQQDNSNILFSVTNNLRQGKLPSVDIYDISIIRKYGIDMDEDILNQPSYDSISTTLSEYSENVVTYIAGYVVKMLKKHIKCLTCLDATTGELESSSKFSLLRQKQKGGLIVPSEGILKVCNIVEKKIRKMLIITNNRMPAEGTYMQQLINCVSNQLLEKNIFPTLENHIYDSEIGDEIHVSRLLKKIVFCYTKIRLNSICKKCTENEKGELIRKKLTKLILFKNQ